MQDMTSIDGIGYDDDGATDDSSSTAGTADSHRNLELRCVLAVIRHGDRTPKQKMKVTVTQVRLPGLPEIKVCIYLRHIRCYTSGLLAA